MGVREEVAASVIRVSFGPSTTENDLARFLGEWRDRRSCQGEGRMIYLDYQASTPVAPEVAKAMLPWIEERFANPHSPSRWGSEAGAAIEVARKRVEKAIGLKGGSAAFTGSATEALNWALKGTVEKASRGAAGLSRSPRNMRPCSTLRVAGGAGHRPHVLPVGPDGRLDIELLAANSINGCSLSR